MIQAAQEMAPRVGIAPACRVIGLPRATFYRIARPAPKALAPIPKPRKPSPRALSPEEIDRVLRELHSERFIDRAPAEVVATLLDEGRWLCSERSMSRILGAEGEVVERRNQSWHPKFEMPQLHATGPNQVWSLALSLKSGHLSYAATAAPERTSLS